MSEKKKYRINLGTFDLAKGIAVIMIVLGHKLFYYEQDAVALLGPVALLFAVFQYGINPMFFIVSGFGFKGQPAKKMLRKTFSELIKPYLYVMLAYAVCFPTIHYAFFRWWPGAIHEGTRYVLAFVLGLAEDGKKFLGYELYDCTAVWFFLSLFISLNLLNQILRIKSEKLQGLVVLLCAVAGYVLAQVEFNYYCIHQSLLGVGYCYVGHYVKKHAVYKNKYLPWICVGLTFVSILHVHFGDFSMAYGTYKYGFVECILAGCSGLLALFLCIAVSRVEWRCLDPIKKIGMYAYWIMCIHAVDMSCIPWYRWSAAMAEHQVLAYWIEVALTVLIITSGCTVLKKIAKYKYANGRLRKNE